MLFSTFTVFSLLLHALFSTKLRLHFTMDTFQQLPSLSFFLDMKVPGFGVQGEVCGGPRTPAARSLHVVAWNANYWPKRAESVLPALGRAAVSSSSSGVCSTPLGGGGTL